MIRRSFVITKEKLDNMLSSEKERFLERMVEDMEDSEMICIYVNGFSQEELKVDSIEITL